MNNSQDPIAFFDSGIGGLAYLSAARAKLPNERFVYLADRAGFPYGEKSHDEVIELALRSTKKLVEKTNAKALVIACNTATEHAISSIREALKDIPVVGTVPAIKPAAMLSKTRCIGVVATQSAVAAKYLDQLAQDWASNCKLIKIANGALVEFVEHRMLEASPVERIEAVRPCVETMLNASCDAIILGCTHFVHLTKEFKTIAANNAQIIDSREGVTNRLVSVLTNPSTCKQEIADKMYLSGQGDFSEMFCKFAESFGLEKAGIL